MPPPELTPQQKQNLRDYAEDFIAWLKTDKGIEDARGHREQERFFKERLSLENIERMTEEEFAGVYMRLWASQAWSNKDWYVRNRLILPNGLDKIKAELIKLLYSSADIAKRYDEFKNNIKGFGPSSITEILHMVFPETFPLWNDKPKTVLPFLGLNILPDRLFKYQISEGSDYEQVIQALTAAKNELKEFGVNDFMDLDVFFWHIFDDIISKEKPQPPTKRREVVVTARKIAVDSHEAAEYYLLELGKMLGYSPYTVDQSKMYQSKSLGDVALLKEIPAFAGDREMATVKEIDVIWFNEDENPEYAFEVEHTTDIVHGLDRLIQLQHLYVKFVIVAPDDRRSKFESLLQRVQYRKLKDRFRFISYDDLARLFEAAVPFNELKTKLLGEA